LVDTAFRQQRLPAWLPILTPYNVIPTLLILSLLFIPIGIVFLVFSYRVQEYAFDYSSCLQKAPVDRFGPAPSSLGNRPFEWRRLSTFPKSASSEFNPEWTPADTLCELRFKIGKQIGGPVFQYYGLANYYQNQRLYVKSVSWSQLQGEAVPFKDLSECAPLVAPTEEDLNSEDVDPGKEDSSSGNPLINPATGNRIVYYPCGLIANSMFNDTLGALVAEDKSAYIFEANDITWPADGDKYGSSNYVLGDVRPPPFWRSNRRLVKPDGTYRSLPDLQTDNRFQNWMKVAGLPIFRKLYGRTDLSVSPGTYTILISSGMICLSALKLF